MSAQVKQEVFDLFMREGSSNTKACQKIYYARGSGESSLDRISPARFMAIELKTLSVLVKQYSNVGVGFKHSTSGFWILFSNKLLGSSGARFKLPIF